MMMKQQTLTASVNNKKMFRKLLSGIMIAAVVLIFLLLTYYVGTPLVKKFQESPEAFQAYVDAHRVLGSLIMIGVTALQVIVAFIPGEPFELAAGFVFGWGQGTLLCLVSAALASAVVFMAVRKWGTKLIEVFFPREKILQFSFLKSEKKLNLLVFMLFLIPGTPKDLLTYLVGLTPMKLTSFLLLTTIARIPSVVTSAVTGCLTQEGNYIAAVITYGITLAVSAVCALWYRRISKEEAAALSN